VETVLQYYAQAVSQSADVFAARYPFLSLLKPPVALDSADAYVWRPEGTETDEPTAVTALIQAGQPAAPIEESKVDGQWLIAPLVRRTKLNSGVKVTFVRSTGLVYRRAASAIAPIVLGRSNRVDVVLPFASVSKTHAHALLGSNQTIDLVDQASTNGTFVNGKRLVSGVASKVRCGDEVAFGRLVLKLVDPRGLHEQLRKLDLGNVSR